jgi:hypothetical protein
VYSIYSTVYEHYIRKQVTYSWSPGESALPL